jgi:hypothetical protein
LPYSTQCLVPTNSLNHTTRTELGVGNCRKGSVSSMGGVDQVFSTSHTASAAITSSAKRLLEMEEKPLLIFNGKLTPNQNIYQFNTNR